MNRRDFLRGLLALPLLKLLPKPADSGHRVVRRSALPTVGVDLSKGSDQTSIWFVNWGESNRYLQSAPWDPSKVRLGSRNWLKESIRG